MLLYKYLTKTSCCSLLNDLTNPVKSFKLLLLRIEHNTSNTVFECNSFVLRSATYGTLSNAKLNACWNCPDDKLDRIWLATCWTCSLVVGGISVGSKSSFVKWASGSNASISMLLQSSDTIVILVLLLLSLLLYSYRELLVWN